MTDCMVALEMIHIFSILEMGRIRLMIMTKRKEIKTRLYSENESMQRI